MDDKRPEGWYVADSGFDHWSARYAWAVVGCIAVRVEDQHRRQPIPLMATSRPTTRLRPRYTALYVSIYDQNNQALLAVNSLVSGDDITLYEAGQISTWNRYTLTADPVLNGTPVEWATLPVVFAETGPSAFTPAGNTQVVLSIPAAHALTIGGYLDTGPPYTAHVDTTYLELFPPMFANDGGPNTVEVGVNNFTSTTAGTVPASNGGTTKFLRADYHA